MCVVCYVLLSQIQLLATTGMTDVHRILASAALLSICRLMLMASFKISSSLLWASSFPAAFYFSQHDCLFQRTLSSHDVPKVGKIQFFSFLPPAMFWVYFLL